MIALRFQSSATFVTQTNYDQQDLKLKELKSSDGLFAGEHSL